MRLNKYLHFRLKVKLITQNDECFRPIWRQHGLSVGSQNLHIAFNHLFPEKESKQARLKKDFIFYRADFGDMQDNFVLER